LVSPTIPHLGIFRPALLGNLQPALLGNFRPALTLGLGYESVAAHEQGLTRYVTDVLSKVPHLNLLGPPAGRPSAPLATFYVKGLESGAIAKALGNRANVVVRSGFHCAQPAHEHLALGPTVRASFAIYNTRAEIDAMVETLHALARFCH
jgi:cysteine desulfurase/selenocysteine lyase